MLDTRDHAPSVHSRRSPGLDGTGGRDSHASPRAQKHGNTAASLEDFLHGVRFDPNDPAALGTVLRALVERGYDRAPLLPLPAHGHTLARWRALAAVAACDLGLVKLFEGHTDALAILAELHGPTPPAASRWAVWAAEPPDARVQASKVGIRTDNMQVQLAGTKAWCSGAGVSQSCARHRMDG